MIATVVARKKEREAERLSDTYMAQQANSVSIVAAVFVSVASHLERSHSRAHLRCDYDVCYE